MWISIEPRDGPARVVEAGDGVVIGRRAECDLVLDDSQVSGRHAEIQATGDGGLVLRDLGSTNGTRVDGVRLEGPGTLRGGEEIRIGETVLRASTTDPRLAPASPPTAVAGAAAAGAAGAGAAAGAAPAAGAVPPPPASASRIERLRLARTANRALLLAAGAVVVAIAAIVLAVTGVFSSSKEKPTVAQVVKAVAPSTVLIIGERGGQPVEKGTGWVLDAAQGLVVTNNHVVQGGETLKVGVGRTNNGSALSERRAEIVGTAPCEDIAVIRVTPGTGLKTLPLGSQAKLSEGDGVVGLGFPANASFRDNLVATSGVISTVRTVYEAAADVPSLPNVVQTDAAINPGNSGGPLVSFDEKLVGMNTAGYTAAGGRIIQGQGYAIGVDRIRQITARLRQGRSIGWAGLGLDFPDPDKLKAAGAPSGLLVTHTESGSPASRIPELNQGTVLLVGVNGKRLDTTLRSYCDAVRGIRTGQGGQIAFLDGNGQLRTATLPFS